jgi:hypothetical protein
MSWGAVLAPLQVTAALLAVCVWKYDSCAAAASFDELAPVAYHQPHGLHVRLSCYTSASTLPLPELLWQKLLRHSFWGQALSLRMLQGAKVISPRVADDSCP